MALNFMKICRTCALVGNLNFIFDDVKVNKPFKISEMLMEVANIKVLEEDDLPKNICNKCKEQLIAAFLFKKQCIQVDIDLKNYLNTNKSNNTIKEESASKEDQQLIENTKNDSIPKSKELYCIKCNKYYKSFRFLTHQRIHLKPFICQTCGTRFGSNSNLKRHLKKHTQEDLHFCQICNKSFIQAINLKKHLNTHVQTRQIGDDDDKTKFICDNCNQIFSSNSSLKRHKKRHTGEKPYTCHVCNKGFIQLVALTDHIRVHTGEKPYNCTNCKQSFTTASNLRVHKRKHLPKENNSNTITTTKIVAQYTCNICLRSFLTKRALKKHSILHGDKKFLCSNCGKCFISKDGLICHERVHTGIRPYICLTCNKSFSYKSSLKIHERIHLGIRPYNCTVCSKTFSHHTHLKNHLKTHTISVDEKPFSCTICKKKFSFKGNLTVHLRIHSGDKPYSCQLCENQFNNFNSLKKHQKQHLS